MSRLEQLVVGLGKGSDRSEIVTSAILTSVTFFYAYTISSFLRLDVIILKDRVVYDNPFEQYIFGSYSDSIIISLGIFIWLYISLRRSKERYIGCTIYGVLLITAVSAGLSFLEIFSVMAFPLVIGMAICSSKTNLLRRRREVFITNWMLYLDYLSLIFITASILSIVLAVDSFLLFNVHNDSLRNYAYEIFVMLTPAAAFLLALLVFAFPLKLIARELLLIFPSLRKLKIWLNNADHLTGRADKNENGQSLARNKLSVLKNSTKERKRILLLLPILALSVTLAFIPQQPVLNKDNRLVGVDTDHYVKWINKLEDSLDEGTFEFFRQLFSVQGVDGDRPLSLFFMFITTRAISAEDMAQTIDFSPVVLSPMLVLSVYYFTRQLTSSLTVALLAAFLTTISFQVLIGIFAGFFANWIALIIGYFSLGYLFKFLRDARKSSLAAFSALLVLTLFAHIYTWTIISLCAGIFLTLLIALRRTDFSRQAIILGLIVIAATVLIDVSKSLATNSSSGIIEDVQLSDVSMGPDEFFRRWDILAFTVYSSLEGIFANSIILLLGLYWLLRSDYGTSSTLFLLGFLSIAILPLFFGDWVIQSRILYIIPFQIPAALALTYILSHDNYTRTSDKKLVIGVSRVLSVFAICAILSAVAVSVLSNLYLVLPTQ